jgi:general secretion pathway protein I
MKQRGFTLIEVLVALSIASVGLIGLIKAQTQSVQNLTHLQQKTLASLVASNIAIEKRLSGPHTLGFKNGKYKMGKQTWYWQTNANSTPSADIIKLSLSVFASKQLMNDKNPASKIELYLAK